MNPLGFSHDKLIWLISRCFAIHESFGVQYHLECEK